MAKKFKTKSIRKATFAPAYLGGVTYGTNRVIRGKNGLVEIAFNSDGSVDALNSGPLSSYGKKIYREHNRNGEYENGEYEVPRTVRFKNGGSSYTVSTKKTPEQIMAQAQKIEDEARKRLDGEIQNLPPYGMSKEERDAFNRRREVLEKRISKSNTTRLDMGTFDDAVQKRGGVQFFAKSAAVGMSVS